MGQAENMKIRRPFTLKIYLILNRFIQMNNQNDLFKTDKAITRLAVYSSQRGNTPLSLLNYDYIIILSCLLQIFYV